MAVLVPAELLDPLQQPLDLPLVLADHRHCVHGHPSPSAVT
jgi:hypothetical protein